MKKLGVFLAVVLGLCAFAACGGNDNNTSDGGSSSSSASLSTGSNGSSSSSSSGGGAPEGMVYIAPGTFMMGSPTSEAGRFTNEDQHQVTLMKSFYMGKYLVTQELYQSVTGVNPSYNQGESRLPAEGEEQAKRPVENVTWFDAVEFCNKLSENEGLQPMYTFISRMPATGYPITNAQVAILDWGKSGYRLPTDAEWEYACRAGTTTAWCMGDTEVGPPHINVYAWYSSNAGGKTHEVGKKAANAWGLYDMHGNVYEWCWDWYSSSLGTNPVTDPVGPGPSTQWRKVYRNGSTPSNYSTLRSAFRFYRNPVERSQLLGFRVVRLAP